MAVENAFYGQVLGSGEIEGRYVDSAEVAAKRVAKFEAWAKEERARKTTLPGWQPIETAPKDGTDIWLGRVNGCRQIAFWKRHQNEWYDRNWHIITFTPTHWMPLPEPPC
jgi:hypothetical protein